MSLLRALAAPPSFLVDGVPAVGGVEPFGELVAVLALGLSLVMVAVVMVIN
ncbi:MAG: hypothetical protein AAGD22_12525 [Verrucomicrobiota bacterium]